MRKLTHEEYENRLFEREIDVYPVEQYRGSATKINHTCLEGHIWSATPSNILNGIGCPHCSGKFKKTDAIYKSELLGKNCINIEPYINARTAILHKCYSCDTEWKVRPYSILSNGSNCPKCAIGGGFNPNLEGRLYYIKIIRDNETYYKIGITNHSVSYRFRADNDKQIIILMEEFYLNGAIAEAREKELLKKYECDRVNIPGFLKSNGNSELFEKDILNLDLDLEPA